ncbi:hypothetical protein ACJX0J_035336, partial [Zea mays]
EVDTDFITAEIRKNFSTSKMEIYRMTTLSASALDRSTFNASFDHAFLVQGRNIYGILYY